MECCRTHRPTNTSVRSPFTFPPDRRLTPCDGATDGLDFTFLRSYCRGANLRALIKSLKWPAAVQAPLAAAFALLSPSLTSPFTSPLFGEDAALVPHESTADRYEGRPSRTKETLLSAEVYGALLASWQAEDPSWRSYFGTAAEARRLNPVGRVSTWQTVNSRSFTARRVHEGNSFITFQHQQCPKPGLHRLFCPPLPGAWTARRHFRPRPSFPSDPPRFLSAIPSPAGYPCAPGARSPSRYRPACSRALALGPLGPAHSRLWLCRVPVHYSRFESRLMEVSAHFGRPEPLFTFVSTSRADALCCGHSIDCQRR